MAGPAEEEEYGRELERILPDRIERNPDNPRLLFAQSELDALAKSIKEVGILVPLIVFRKVHEADQYILLDGERRWRCATKLNLPDVPCHIIAPPTRVENILRMFNIHNVREDWELMPTALKLGTLMELLGTKNEDNLARLTGLSKANVGRCKKLLSFDDTYQDMILKGRMKSDFFIEMYPVLNLLKRNYPEIYKQRSRNGLIESFIRKQDEGAIKAVTDFRYISKMIRGPAKGVPKQRIRRNLEKLVWEVELSVEDVYRSTVEATYGAADLVKESEGLHEALSEFDPKGVSELEAKRLLWALTELREQIDRILRTLER